ncbi:PAS domain S-box protein [Candidatus Omnitrophota bacterium]
MIEVIGALFALCLAFLILSRFIALGERIYLIVALGFAIAGIEDFVHGALEIMGNVVYVTGSERFIPGTYVAGRAALVFMLIFAAVVPEKKTLNVKREAFTFGTIALILGTLATYIATKLPLPQFIYPGQVISRPVDLVVGLFYLGAIPLYIKRYSRNRDPFLWTIVLSLILGLVAEIYMVHSQGLYDAQFDFSHLMKVLSYVVPIMGFGVALIFLYREERELVENLKKSTVSRSKLLEQISEREKIEEEKEKFFEELKERNKELTVLYAFSKAMEESGNSIETICQKTAEILRGGLRYPDITCVRIALDGKEFKTDNFRATEWNQTAEIKVHAKKTGSVEVYYLEEKARRDEGPFLKEERALIGSIAERIGDVLQRLERETVFVGEQKKWRDIIDSMEDGVTITSVDGKITDINKAALEKHGYTWEEVKGKTPGEIFMPKEEEPKFQMVIKKLQSGEKMTNKQFQGRHKNGRIFPVSVNSSFVRGLANEPTAIINVHRDITELKKIEEDLRESRDKYERLYRSSLDAIMTLVPGGQFLSGNLATIKLFGCRDEDEFISKTPAELSPEYQPDGKPSSQKAQEMMAIATEKGHHFFEWKHKRVNGESFDATVLLGAVQVGEKNILMATVHDVSEAKEAKEGLERSVQYEKEARRMMMSMLDDNNQIREKLEKNLKELKETQGMLVQSEKLASLGKLVSDMAHEVNNPLMVISGRSQLTMMDASEKKDKSTEKNMQIVMDQCQRAKSIIQRLLVFSKPSKGEESENNINEVVQFVIDLLEHQFSLVNIKIVKNFAAEMPSITIDEKQIHEVMMNLLKNASEAMPDGGTITVSTAVEKGNVRVDISDTGSGIPEENLKKIFDPFFTTKESGTGLGLSVCYGIVKAHGGTMEYVSTVGKGTTGIIRLPLEGGGVGTSR